MIITNLSLLSRDEYMKYASFSLIPDKEFDWWLKTPYNNALPENYVCTVDFAGFFDDSICSQCNIGVRPVCYFEIELTDKEFWYKEKCLKNLIGSKIEHGGYSWTTLDVTKSQLLVLCDECIAYRCFDPKTNVWENSELKTWLETKAINLITKRNKREKNV